MRAYHRGDKKQRGKGTNCSLKGAYEKPGFHIMKMPASGNLVDYKCPPIVPEEAGTCSIP
jgi:Holliday junction resolvase